MRRISEDVEQRIYELNNAGVPNTDIAQQLGIAPPTVRAYLQKRKDVRRCPKCRVANPSGSNFCNRCGAQLRSTGQLMAERLKGLLGTCGKHIPTSLQDEFRDTILAGCEMLNRVDE